MQFIASIGAVPAVRFIRYSMVIDMEKTGNPRQDKSKEHLEDLGNFWTKRSDNFSDNVLGSIKDGRYVFWLDMIKQELDGREGLSILDCGCGPGFFSIILGREGHRMTAIDYAQGMVEIATNNLREYGVECKVSQMDAQNLQFPDETFDIVVSRNILWTLENPRKAYSEWLRVLKPGGKIINFSGNAMLSRNDADYALIREMKDRDRMDYSDPKWGPTVEEFEKMEEITCGDCEANKHRRPVWDAELLVSLGAVDIRMQVDGINGDYLDKEGGREYFPNAFKITATKGSPSSPTFDVH